MKKILMILTNARRDCCRITLEMLERSGAYPAFDHVVFLLNGVSDKHMLFVDEHIKKHPDIPFDKILGSGIRPQGIADMQNRCIEKYPDALYMKVDEDIFVPSGWAQRMLAAYEANKHQDNLALITPLIPNNAYGLHILLTRFYPDLFAEFRSRFNHDPDPARTGSTWQDPHIAEWATRKFIHLERANEEQRRRLRAEDGDQKSEVGGRKSESNDKPPITNSQSLISNNYSPFSDPFSIGCIAYDYRHWQKMGGIPETDEPGWTQWIKDHGQINILDCSQIVLHYSFFVQQEWLDRTSLLEDIRRINLPGTLSLPHRLGLARAVRLAQQLPGIIQRRMRRG